MGPCGSLRAFMSPNGPYLSLCVFMGPFWVLTGLYMSLGIFMGPYRTV